MNIPLSIIIPAYNVQDWIGQCLDSIATLPLDKYEVIVVNDGSTDDTKKICEKYYHRIENLYILDQVNQGLSVARNLGIERALGEYLFFLDSDDHIDSSKFVDFFQKTISLDVEISIGNGKNQFGDRIEGVMKKSERISSLSILDGPTFYLMANKFNEFCISPCIKLYKTDFLKKNKISFLASIIHEDELFAPIIFSQAARVIYLEIHFYIRRHRLGSITKNSRHKYYNLKSTGSFITILNQLQKLIVLNKTDSLQNKVFIHALYKNYIEILKRELYYAKENISELKLSDLDKKNISNYIASIRFSLPQKINISRLKIKIFFYKIFKK